MPIEVEGPDGTVVEFPDDTAPETIKGVMAKHYKVQSGRTGKSYDFEVPDGADPVDAAQSALRAQEPDTMERPVMAQPTALEAFGGAAQNAVGQMAIGAGILPDLASKAASGINNAFVNAGAAVADPVLRAFGADGAADAVGRFAERTTSQPAPTIEGMVRRSNPAVNQPGNGLANFGFQALGGLAVPFGPKAAPAPMRAPVAAAPAKAASTKLVPGAADIVAAGNREGVRVMRSDVAPPRTFIGRSARATGEKIPYVGTGETRAAQQGERIEAVKNLLNEYGAGRAGAAIDDVAKDFAKTRGEQLSSLTKAKTSVIESVQGRIPAQALDRSLKAISAQITRLQGINADAYSPVIAKLKNFEETLQSGKTLEQIEGNRKLLGDMFADTTLASLKTDGQKALNAIYGPLRDDMGAIIESAAGREARTKWKGANDRLAAMAGELDDSAFKAVLKKAETTPEDAAKLIFSEKPSQLRRIFRNLSPEGRTKAQAAILLKSAEGATENGIISPQKFANAMEKMDEATGVFFSPKDKGRIEGLTRLLKATQRASEAAAMPATGVQNVPSVLAGGLGATFGWAAFPIAGSIGLLARAYESAPVRNRLLQLGKTQPGSKAEAFLLRDLNSTLAKMTPVAANDIEAGLVASPTRVAAEEEIQN